MSDILTRLEREERRARLGLPTRRAHVKSTDVTARARKRRAVLKGRSTPTGAPPLPEPSDPRWQRRAQIKMVKDLYLTGHDHNEIAGLLGLSSPRAAYEILKTYYGGVKNL